ncbi:glycoside hydrolase family 19 protein [Salmonella enterica]|uniref:glycoside hydrolase family 19 protein n=1 Tax=Salmonella enterica TaxID=28901 RepID=UPI0009AA709A|nr:glycoside hydrolase family 19 protein [Salmonella enterica]MBA3216980.1 glycoside hydrolase family 19 protein [Salmonella enterica]
MNESQFQQAACISAGLSARWYPHITAAMSEFGITAPLDQASTLGRKACEKALPLERQRAIANLVYSKRMGNNGPGDGWNYRGRGLIQITGLNNYRDCGNGIKTELVAHPDLLAQDTYAARSAAWFFATKGCLKYSGDMVRVTQIINGGQNGIGDRRERFEKAKSVLV